MTGRMMVLMRPNEVKRLSRFAGGLWHDTYDGLLGKPQVEYMMQTVQSEEAIRRQIEEENYIYFFLLAAGARAGYCALKPEEDRLFLSKLYLAAKYRGRGLGQRALAEVAECARRLGLKSVYLTVNKGNERAIRAYERVGFVRTQSLVTDIGAGYVMDDYIYEYTLPVSGGAGAEGVSR